MATTGILDGTLLVVKSGGNAISHATSMEFSRSTSTRNITTKDSGDYEEHAAQRHSWEVSAEGMVAYDATNGYEELATAMEAKSAVSLSWGTFVTGDPEYSGSAIITSLSKSGPLDDNSTFSVTFQGTGDITTGTTA